MSPPRSPTSSLRPRNSDRRQWMGLLLGGLLGLVAAMPLTAQQTGQVAGTVVDAATMRPLEGAQIVLQGTQMGALSNADGRYSIRGVPTGDYTVVARLIGFGQGTAPVTVQVGQTATADFELSEEALAMEEIVVTGEAGAARRKEVGNAISQVDVSQIDQSPVNVESLMQSQAPGLVISETAGSAGSGSTIRLRGNTSVTQGNQPLIYVDGVRIRSEAYPKNVPPVGYSGRSANVTASPLNDINPADIDRIEIIKGAAATTLYGTEASAGVIQIFTQRGTSAAPSYTLQLDQSMDHVLAFGPDPSDFPAEFRDEVEAKSHFGMDPWLRNSLGTRGTLSVRGGLQDLSYFFSGTAEVDQSPMPNDETDAGGVRGNFGWDAASNLHVQWNTSYNKRSIQQTPSGNNAHGLTLQVYRGDRNYVGSQEKAVIDSILDYDIDNTIDHLVTGLTTQYQPTTDISHRFTVGYDRASTEGRQVRPFGFILAPQGIMSNTVFTNETLTLDYAGSFAFDLSDAFRTTLSTGGQYIIDNQRTVTGYSQDFGGPGLPTLESGGLTLSYEDRIREDNAGFFFQNRLGFRDRVFLTGGVRFDGNSSFGEGITWDALEVYPKASLSYVISDEDFWPDELGSVKLRGAWGMAGRAPGAFDKVRTWDPLGGRLGQQPGFIPQNLGNPNLRPEKTQEIELGADMGLLNDRLSAELTWYRARTYDALLPVSSVPSLGGWQNQIQNVGELLNRGVELSLNGQVVRNRDWQWDLGGSLSTNFAEVTDLGEATSFAVNDANEYIIEGHPVPVVLGWRVTNPDEVGEPVFARDTLGANQPQWVIQPRTRLRVPGGIVLQALGEFQLDYYIHDGSTENGIVRSVRWPTCIDVNAAIDAGNGDQLTALERARCIESSTRAGFFIHDASFFKLRNLSARLPLAGLLRNVYSGIGSASLTLSARNALRWIKDMPVFDPEMAGNYGSASEGSVNVDDEGDNNLGRSLSEHIPPPATFTATFRVSFQ